MAGVRGERHWWGQCWRLTTREYRGICSTLMTRRASGRQLALVLLVVLVALTPLAYSSPPDPVWVSGFFDDDDNDNGVFLITSSHITLDPFPLLAWQPVRVFWSSPVHEDQSPGSAPYRSTADARAAPIA